MWWPGTRSLGLERRLREVEEKEILAVLVVLGVDINGLTGGAFGAFLWAL
jgi:hypothetical protein